MKKLLWIIFLLSMLALPACSVLPEVTTVEGEERDAVLKYAEPIADNLFAGMVSADYATFSRDFDDAMLKGLNETAFNEMIASFNEKIGVYQSRQVSKVERVESILVVTYTAKYDNEDEVSVRLSLREGAAPQVAGLWFDSPKLRQK